MKKMFLVAPAVSVCVCGPAPSFPAEKARGFFDSFRLTPPDGADFSSL